MGEQPLLATGSPEPSSASATDHRAVEDGEGNSESSLEARKSLVIYLILAGKIVQDGVCLHYFQTAKNRCLASGRPFDEMIAIAANSEAIWAEYDRIKVGGQQ